MLVFIILHLYLPVAATSGKHTIIWLRPSAIIGSIVDIRCKPYMKNYNCLSLYKYYIWFRSVHSNSHSQLIKNICNNICIFTHVVNHRKLNNICCRLFHCAMSLLSYMCLLKLIAPCSSKKKHRSSSDMMTLITIIIINDLSLHRFSSHRDFDVHQNAYYIICWRRETNLTLNKKKTRVVKINYNSSGVFVVHGQRTLFTIIDWGGGGAALCVRKYDGRVVRNMKKVNGKENNAI